MTDADAFRCNLCGATVTTIPWEALERDHGACPACGAQVRFRAVAHLIGVELYGRSSPAPTWPSTDKIVYGISDWEGFEPAFGRACHYSNTQFDRAAYPDAPFLDILDPPERMLGTADVITCSDVLEHVPPPVQRAFDGLFALLKPGGALVFTVPYTFGETVEHFPELYDWRLQERDGRRLLVNRTRNGDVQEFTELRFHGGGSAVLEMRIFGLPALLAHFERAGFTGVRVMEEDVPEYGIRFDPWSRPVVARRPG